MNYGFDFKGHGVFTPDGKTDIEPSQVKTHNEQVEAEELERLKAHPEHVFAYVKLPVGTLPFSPSAWALAKFDAKPEELPQIRTWMGTPIATHVYIGPRRYVGFGHHTYRRAVTCKIHGVTYHGWYMESSGNYCRLKRAKRQ